MGFWINNAFVFPGSAAAVIRSRDEGFKGVLTAALITSTIELGEASWAPFWKGLGTGALLGAGIECAVKIEDDGVTNLNSITTSAVKGALTGAAITGATRLIRGAILLNTPSLPMEETIRRKKKRAGRR